MSRLARIRNILQKMCLAVALMIAGALMFIWYLRRTDTPLPETIGDTQSALTMLFIIFLSIGISPGEQASGKDYRDVSPRYSGVAVVVITGIAAFMALAPGNYLYGLSIAVGTIAVAAAVWRFATRHAGEIGEARFPGRQAGE